MWRSKHENNVSKYNTKTWNEIDRSVTSVTYEMFKKNDVQKIKIPIFKPKKKKVLWPNK